MITVYVYVFWKLLFRLEETALENEHMLGRCGVLEGSISSLITQKCVSSVTTSYL
jgi:hypothetical protein